MQYDWTTKEKDLAIASQIIEEFIEQTNGAPLGLFEIVINANKKGPDYRISGWVIALAKFFRNEYGYERGDFVTKMILSKCLTNGNTLH